VAGADEGASTPTVNIAHLSYGTPWVGIVIEIVTSVGWEHSIDFGVILSASEIERWKSPSWGECYVSLTR
jgi:hypothetical protein